MKKEITVWKVLDCRTRKSAGIKLNSPLVLRYPVGKFVMPKVGKIFCFGKKEDAVRFVGRKVKWSIHKAIAVNPVPIDTMAIHEDQIKMFWDGKVYGWITPKGSMVCDSLKCLE